jgi:uncharacterized protein (DUF1501 family)
MGLAPEKAPGNIDISTPGLVSLFQDAGKRLAIQDGPRVATVEASGWDTHVNQGAAEGELAGRLAALDGAIAALQEGLGPRAWKKTAIMMATEFGRTVRPNSSGGTDHGTGGAAFLLGGAVQGGRVVAQWVGLSPQRLEDGRDQPARTDLRALFKGLLAEHMNVPKSALEKTVFPDSAGAQPLKALIRC